MFSRILGSTFSRSSSSYNSYSYRLNSRVQTRNFKSFPSIFSNRGRNYDHSNSSSSSNKNGRIFGSALTAKGSPFYWKIAAAIGLPLLFAAPFALDQLFGNSSNAETSAQEIPVETMSTGPSKLRKAFKQARETEPAKPTSTSTHLCSILHYANNPDYQVECHLELSNIDDQMQQAVIYESDKPNSKIVGVEYIVSEDYFNSLPEEEKQLWHSHGYEVKSGAMLAPKVSDEHEHQIMEKMAPTYGKTFIFWKVDEAPMNIPQLMMSPTRDGMINPEILKEREDRLGKGYLTSEKRKNRDDIPMPVKAPGADSWEKGTVEQLLLEQYEVPSATMKTTATSEPQRERAREREREMEVEVEKEVPRDKWWHRTSKEAKEIAKEAASDVTEALQRAKEKSSETLSQTAQTVSDKAVQLKDTAAAKLDHLKHATEEKASELGQRAGEAYESGKKKASGTFESAKQTVNEAIADILYPGEENVLIQRPLPSERESVKEKATESTKRAMEGVKEKTRDLKEELKQLKTEPEMTMKTDAAKAKEKEMKDLFNQIAIEKEKQAEDISEKRREEIKDKNAVMTQVAPPKTEKTHDVAATVSEVVHKIEEKGKDILEKSKELASETVETAKSKFHQVVESTKSTLGSAKDTISHKAEDAKDTAKEMKDKAVQKMDEVKEQASKRVKQKSQQIENIPVAGPSEEGKTPVLDTVLSTILPSEQPTTTTDTELAEKVEVWYDTPWWYRKEVVQIPESDTNEAQDVVVVLVKLPEMENDWRASTKSYAGNMEEVSAPLASEIDKASESAEKKKRDFIDRAKETMVRKRW